jgi:Uma2 family endonuclease
LHVTIEKRSSALIGRAELRFFFFAEHYMAMPAVAKHVWTIEEVERLIDGRPGYTPRYELVDGQLLVTPAPAGRHQRIVAELFVLIRTYIKRQRLGEARFSPGTVRLTPDTRFEPDVYVIPLDGGRMPRAAAPVTSLLLAAEVLSPSSARYDRFTKRRFFQRHEVPEYWVVDGEAEAFEVWHPRDERAALIDDRLLWNPVGARAPFELDVRAFFASVADEEPTQGT